MTKKTRFFAIIAALAAIGFSLAGCDNPAGGNDNNNDIVNGPNNGNGNGNNGNENGNGVTPGVPTFTVTFYSDGGSAVKPQDVTEDGLATAPSAPTREWVPVAGLWAGTLPASYIFGGWLHDGELWDFETDTVTADKTLAATWTAPSPIELDLYGTNLVSAAVAHVNNPANAGAFTLAIDDEYIHSGRNELYSDGAELTIIGLGERREIRFTDTDDDQRLFTVGRSGGTTFATLRLGDNITLVGRDNNANDLVRVQNNGHLYMEYGAWITGHSNSAGNGAAVHVSDSSRFTMNGGRIFGNTTPNAGTNQAGGVLLDNFTVFIMTGGSIDENYRGTGANVVPADVMAFASQGNPFTISGGASIHRLSLNHSGGNNNAFIRVGPKWTGNISRLDLRRNVAIGTVVNDWINTTRGVLEPTGGRTLNDDDLDNILAVYFLGNAEATNRPFVSAGGTVNYEIVLADDGARGVVRRAAGLWDTATWQRVSAVPANDVAAAMTHVNANTGPFTLAIDQNVTATATLELSANADLTIVGIGGEREISRTTTGRLFLVAASEARLTLGENITLRGNQVSADLVRVQNGGRFYMEDGSIRGHTNGATSTANGAGAAVNVGNNGTFTMSGGRITGNTAVNASTNISGGVFMYNANSRFIMTGGRIYGNHRGNGAAPADIFVTDTVDHFTLSGDARIDRLILGTSGTTNSFITVGSDWSGGVAYLDLRANAGLDIVRNTWTGSMVLQAAEGRTLTTADVGRIDWNTARFTGSSEGVTELVSQTSRIVLEDGDTVGMLRANP